MRVSQHAPGKALTIRSVRKLGLWTLRTGPRPAQFPTPVRCATGTRQSLACVAAVSFLMFVMSGNKNGALARVGEGTVATLLFTGRLPAQ